jgi:phytoene/squalene synthetase
MSTSLSAAITKAASKQTYYIIRLLVDRERANDAYRSYAYFRWVDDVLDAGEGLSAERRDFIERQKSLLQLCYLGKAPRVASDREQMLVELVGRDHEQNSGLQAYLRNMMQALDFDAWRRGRLVAQAELSEYTRWLAVSVTEAIHYFIGHGSYAPQDETRYLAVSGAHIAHLLRDTYEDVKAGYYNIPREVLEANHIEPHEVHSEPYRIWVSSRVRLARDHFTAARGYFARIQSPRARLAGMAYTARFEWLLDTIEQDDYRLRPQYIQRRSMGTVFRLGSLALASAIKPRAAMTIPEPVGPRSLAKLKSKPVTAVTESARAASD